MQNFDVIVVGASFAGLTFAHHIPKNWKVLVIDLKPEPGSTVESTGLITTATRDEFRAFFDIDLYITNPITGICVVAPKYADQFVSQVEQPWIFQTDTKALIKALAEQLPTHVELRMRTAFRGAQNVAGGKQITIQTQGQEKEIIATRFLVGADGSHSKVAMECGLESNRRFLFGYEQVFYGRVHMGPKPEETITHFWFGEFSLGYGGWISPTVVNGKPAFRVGLAKLEKDRGAAKELMGRFLQDLLARKLITIEGEIDKPGYVFGSLIPIGGALKCIAADGVLLIGDAAGFCGAFAADGINGSVISGKEAAAVVDRALQGGNVSPKELHWRIRERCGILDYYARQLRYRWVWDLMQRDRTFRAMYDIIADERETFLEQFCGSKDKHRSLSCTVLKIRHVPKLVKYGIFIFLDLFSRGL